MPKIKRDKSQAIVIGDVTFKRYAIQITSPDVPYKSRNISLIDHTGELSLQSLKDKIIDMLAKENERLKTIHKNRTRRS